MSWDCQCRSSKPATCQLFTQPASYLLNLPTYFPTCKLFSQTCQLFPQPANFLPKPANFFPNLPTFSLNLPTFSQTCQLLSHDLGGDPPPVFFFLPEKMKSAREAIFWHFFGFFLGWKIIFSPTFPKIFSGTLKFSRAQNDIFSRVEVRISRAKS